MLVFELLQLMFMHSTLRVEEIEIVQCENDQVYSLFTSKICFDFCHHINSEEMLSRNSHSLLGEN